MKLRTKPDRPREMSLEASPFFQARLEWLEGHPTMLRPLIEKGNEHLLNHLREITNRAEQAMAELLVKEVPEDQAEERVLAEVVRDDPSRNPGRTAPPLSLDLSKAIRTFKTWVAEQPATYATEITE